MTLAIVLNVVLGVVMLGLLWWRRSPDAATLASPEEALAQFRRHFPEATGRATLASDARGALLELEPGEVGLLLRDGRRWNARLLVPREVSRVRVIGENRIEIRFTDFAWPRAQLRIDDSGLRAAWVERLEGSLLKPKAGPRSDLRHA